ncbi:MAG TPA: hypothetical protein VNR87_03395 [Flavisolibacter sp.]|nr:hypothetical protein [Flavisolibacter sp.]
MKKQFVNNLSRTKKSILNLGLAGILFVGLPSVVNAEEKPGTPSGVSVNYVGSVDNQPVFQIEFDNKNEEQFTISIKDSDGNVLYVERSKDKKFVKRFKYQGEEAVKLTFVLSTDKEKQAQVFEVNKSIRVVQDVVVNRL